MSAQKIESLTPKQTEALIKFKAEWFAIGSSCKPADFEVAEKVLRGFYKRLGKDEPKFVFKGTPATCLLMIGLLKDKKKPLLGASLEDSLRGSLGASLIASLETSLCGSLVASLEDSLQGSLGASLGTSLRGSLVASLVASLDAWLQGSLENSLGASLVASLETSLCGSLVASLETSLCGSLVASLVASLETSLHGSLGASLETSLCGSLVASLVASLETSLHGSLENSLGTSLRDSLREVFYGQEYAYWISFYLFPKMHIKRDIYSKENLSLLKEWATLARSCGWWWPYKNWLLIADRPKAIHWNNAPNPLLHAVGKPALEYRDGWKVYCLNGVRMEEWMVMTPLDKIELPKVIAIKNAQQRAEMLRRIGIERLLDHLPYKVLDTQGDYQLLSICLDENMWSPYLKMKNPSVGIWHLEGVENGIKTVQEALNWRWPSCEKYQIDWKPEVIT